MYMKKYFLLSLMALTLVACSNEEQEFPDFDYSTVYFAYQYPVRTLTLGETLYNNELDNAHKVKLMATWGGGYTNKKDVVIDVEVDSVLCRNLYFKNNNAKVQVMPASYYELADSKIKIPAGSIIGGVEIKLTDAFFNDPLALSRNYVIPVVMKKVSGADYILTGEAVPTVDSPNRNQADHWITLPKDYVLYAVRYINTWDGSYLRRGKDEITSGGVTTTSVRHRPAVENDELCKLSTVSLSKIDFPVKYYDANGNVVNQASLELIFDANGNCTIGSRTAGVTATGTGSFKKKSELKSWGNKDRDALYLDYAIDFGARRYATRDTLVARDRGIIMETFEVVVK